MQELDLSTINNMLIVRFSSLGDILLTTPLIRSLKKQYPNLNIDFLLREEYADALEYNKNINTLFLLKRDERETELLKRMNDVNYDLIIDLQNNIRSRRITKKMNGKIQKFKKPFIKKFLLVKFKINLLKYQTQIPYRYAEAIPRFQLDNEGLDLYLPDQNKHDDNEVHNIVGFCPGSRHFTKQWPMEYFIELGNLLRGNGIDVALFGGREDIDVCEKIAEQISGAVNLSNDNNLFKTAYEMKRCKLILCNDSGLMHTAAALRVPVIAIFGSTVKEFGFAPYKSKNLILENNLLSCRPCSHIGRSKCPEGHFKCMKELTAENIYEKFINYFNSL
ncbi:glycosyltransferase family 9 protein [Bacteroidota bacterium]